MRVREDGVEHPDGSPGIYGVVEKRDFALVIPLEDGHVHLVEQYRYTVSARYWEFPQGTWDVDAPPEELARGELAEETGLRAERMEHIGHLFEAYGHSTQGLDVFVASGLTQGPRDLEPSEADMRTGRFTRAELEAMILSGKVKDAATVAAYGLLLMRERE